MNLPVNTPRDYIYNIIQVIPSGKVIYYGQISEVLFAFHEIFMRGQVVGWAMSSMKKNTFQTHKYDDCNWQRVVAKTGVIATFKLGLVGSLQVNLLEKEGVLLNKEGLVDMLKYCLETKELIRLYQTSLLTSI